MVYLIIGLSVGALGTLVGAGGGFILVPLLIYKMPHLPASNIAAMSMLAVSSNALSGSIAYAFKKQIHWKSAFLFGLTALPGVYLGVVLSHEVNKRLFAVLLGVLIIGLALFLFMKSRRKEIFIEEQLPPFFFDRRKAIWGSAMSVLIGVISSFLGIGGGIIHVPLLGTVLHYPIHLAAGTSHFILALTSVFAVTEHWRSGNYQYSSEFLVFLIIGVVLGAQIGAYFSKHVSSSKILRILSVALLFGGLRLCLY